VLLSCCSIRPAAVDDLLVEVIGPGDGLADRIPAAELLGDRAVPDVVEVRVVAVEADGDEESDDDELELDEEDEESALSFFSACLASCLSAPDSADSRSSRLRRLVP